MCEKNWIFITKNNKKYIIYRWFPYEIGVLNDNNEINIIKSITLNPPYIFRNMRGSSPFINYSINNIACNYNGDWLIGVIHYSIDQYEYSLIARKYYHCLVLLNPISLLPCYLTTPFTFCENHGIEFCIGINYKNDFFTFWVSIMDESPREFHLHKDKLNFNINLMNDTIDSGIYSGHLR